MQKKASLGFKYHQSVLGSINTSNRALPARASGKPAALRCHSVLMALRLATASVS
jgi:hypothetical protein